MFLIRSAESKQLDAKLLEQELLQQLSGARSVASLTFIFGHFQQIQLLAESSSALWQTSRLWLGGSSCIAALSDQDLYLSDAAVSVLQITDEQGQYGVGWSCLRSSPSIDTAVQQALSFAMAQAGLQLELGEKPTMLWCYQMPGYEEAVLTCLTALLGQDVPVYGGSSADDDLSGQWWQVANGQLGQHLLVLAVLKPSVPLKGAFAAGYRLTGQSARVTRTSHRELIELDHQPAADVYRRWLGLSPYSLFERTTILSQSALMPLGRVVGGSASEPVLLLSHPAYVEPDQRIGLFSDIQMHDVVHLVAGNEQELALKAGAVVGESCRQLIEAGSLPSGGLIVFCAGSMLAIRPHLADVLRHVRRQLPELPFVVTFTFGEQGTFVDGQSRHGNLMISATVFGSHHA